MYSNKLILNMTCNFNALINYNLSAYLRNSPNTSLDVLFIFAKDWYNSFKIY